MENVKFLVTGNVKLSFSLGNGCQKEVGGCLLLANPCAGVPANVARTPNVEGVKRNASNLPLEPRAESSVAALVRIHWKEGGHVTPPS